MLMGKIKKVLALTIVGAMMVSMVFNTMTFATTSSENTISSGVSIYTFDATKLACGTADKEELSASELSAPFGVDGSVKKRCSWADEDKTTPKAITSVEIARANGSALTVTVDGPATITAKMSSTSGSNTSAIGIADASGNILVQDTVTGTANDAKEITANVTSAGTYRVMSPADEANNRGARIYTVTVTSSSNTTTEETTETTTTTPAENSYSVVAHSNETDEVYNTALPKVVSETDTNNTKVFTGADGNVYAYTDEVTITLKFNADVVNGRGTLLTFQTTNAYGGLADSNRIALRLTDNNGTAVFSKGDDAAAVAGTFIAGDNTVIVKYNPATKAGSLSLNGTETAFTDGDVADICGVKFIKKTSRVITINEYSVVVNGSASTVTTETTTETTTEATFPTKYPESNIEKIKNGSCGVIAEVAGAVDGKVYAQKGDYIDVDFVVYNSNDIHSMIYFIEYDPNVLLLEKFNDSSATGIDMLSCESGRYKYYFAKPSELNDTDGNLYAKPDPADPDFTDLNTDGTKTEPELGRIKDAQLAAKGTTALGTIAADKAVLVSGHFKVVGDVGDTCPLVYRFASAVTSNLVDLDILGSTSYITLTDEILSGNDTSYDTIDGFTIRDTDKTDKSFELIVDTTKFGGQVTEENKPLYFEGISLMANEENTTGSSISVTSSKMYYHYDEGDTDKQYAIFPIDLSSSKSGSFTIRGKIDTKPAGEPTGKVTSYVTTPITISFEEAKKLGFVIENTNSVVEESNQRNSLTF